MTVAACWERCPSLVGLLHGCTFCCLLLCSDLPWYNCHGWLRGGKNKFLSMLKSWGPGRFICFCCVNLCFAFRMAKTTTKQQKNVNKTLTVAWWGAWHEWMPTVVCFLCAVATSTHIAEILTGELFGCFPPIYCKSSHENWHTCVMQYFFVFYDSDCDVQNTLLLLLLNPSLCTPSPPLKTVILIERTVDCDCERRHW